MRVLDLNPLQRKLHSYVPNQFHTLSHSRQRHMVRYWGIPWSFPQLGVGSFFRSRFQRFIAPGGTDRLPLPFLVADMLLQFGGQIRRKKSNGRGPEEISWPFSQVAGYLPFAQYYWFCIDLHLQTEPVILEIFVAYFQTAHSCRWGCFENFRCGIWKSKKKHVYGKS